MDIAELPDNAFGLIVPGGILAVQGHPARQKWPLKHDWPYIDAIVDERLFVTTSGNGAAAKSSDEIGRLGALLASGQWDESYKREAFRVEY